MQINFLTPQFNTVIKQNNKYSTPIQRPKLHEQPNTDTVSFTAARLPKKVQKAATTKMKDVVTQSYETKLPQYKIYATRLMLALKSVAQKFESRGVKFDEDYCKHGAVKSTESFISKFIRSGEKPMDRVRSTLYVQDPHDFKLINEILEELRHCGYEVSNIPGTRKPDFDIRLANVTEEELSHLRADLQGCLGKPQKTGYEDIQMRLVDTTNKKAPAMELIILFGEKTAHAKIDESRYSYNIRRALEKLLHVARVENPEANTPAYRIKGNIGIICDRLSSAISKPLFFNAKNADYLHDSFRLPVELSEKMCSALEGLTQGIRTKIPQHYRAEIDKIKAMKDSEIIAHIKESTEYLNRDDKTIYVADIIEKRKELIAELRQQKADDLDTIQKIQAELRATIEKYGPQPPKPQKGKPKA